MSKSTGLAVGADGAVIDTQKDKYLTFHLGGEEYAIEIRHVTEIIGMQDITEVPDMPAYLKGVINLRGKVIPVIDVRSRFGMAEIEYGPRTCNIIIKLDDNLVGLIVDEVSEVINITADAVDEPPKTMKGTRSRFIQGFGKVEGGVKILLDVERLLGDEEKEMIGELS
ncbi:MAG: chemotaxis protein CheW [Chloroflexota bacterium]